MQDNKVLGIRYVVGRDYSARNIAPELGFHALADFREEEYAREYLKILKRQWKATEKMHPGQHFVWRLYKRTDFYPGEHPAGCEWELIEG